MVWGGKRTSAGGQRVGDGGVGRVVAVGQTRECRLANEREGASAIELRRRRADAHEAVRRRRQRAAHRRCNRERLFWELEAYRIQQTHALSSSGILVRPARLPRRQVLVTDRRRRAVHHIGVIVARIGHGVADAVL